MLDGMTNVKAREVLKELRVYTEDLPHYSPDEVAEAFEIAIKALEQQPCEDCISRTELLARIDAERKHLLDIKMDGAEHIIVHHARRIIEDMPSVTPTIPEVENNYNIGYNCGYADAMSDVADMRGDADED